MERSDQAGPVRGDAQSPRGPTLARVRRAPPATLRFSCNSEESGARESQPPGDAAQPDKRTAARGLGGSGLRIILSHVFPNTLPPLTVQTTLAVAFAVLEAAALGFLGLGAQPPTPEWGAMLADSYKFFTSGAWWAFFFPGAAIMLSVLGFNLVGDALRDALDPRLRT